MAAVTRSMYGEILTHRISCHNWTLLHLPMIIIITENVCLVTIGDIKKATSAQQIVDCVRHWQCIRDDNSWRAGFFLIRTVSSSGSEQGGNSVSFQWQEHGRTKIQWDQFWTTLDLGWALARVPSSNLQAKDWRHDSTLHSNIL